MHAAVVLLLHCCCTVVHASRHAHAQAAHAAALGPWGVAIFENQNSPFLTCLHLAILALACMLVGLVVLLSVSSGPMGQKPLEGALNEVLGPAGLGVVLHLI